MTQGLAKAPSTARMPSSSNASTDRGAGAVTDHATVGVIMSSTVDAPPLLAVAKELTGRRLSVRVYVVGRPGWRAAQAMARKAGFEAAIIGREKPLGALRFLRTEGLGAFLLSIDNLYFHATLIDAARQLGVVSILVQEAANELIQTIAVRKGPGVLVRQLDRAWFQVRAMLSNGSILGLMELAGQTVLSRRRPMPGYGFHQVDLFCTATDRIASIYRSRGTRAIDVVPTGVPKLIPAIELRPADYDYVLLTQPFNIGGLLTRREKKEVFSELVRVIRGAHPDARILCKCHPAEDPREYAGLQVDAFSNDLAQAIAVSRVAVSIHSAALLACVANGRLGIAFVPPMLSQTKNIVIIELEPFGLVVRDPAALAELVGRIRRGELTFDHVRTLQQAWARCLDGQAAARIADRVLGLLEHREVVSRHEDLPDRGPCMTSAGDPAHDGQSARTVLLMVNARSHFLELVTIGCLLRDERGWDPVFCFVGSYGGAEDDQQRCDGEGIPWVTFASAAPRPSWQLRFVRAALRVIEMLADVVRIPMTPFYLTARWLYRWLSTWQARPLRHGIGRPIRAIGRLAFALRSALGRARKRLYEGGLKGLVPRFILKRSLLLQLIRRKVELACARRLMARIQPKLVILAEDNVESAAPAVIKMAHEHGAKAAILPYTLATAAEPAESYWDNRAHQLKGISNRVAGWLYPSWIHEHRGRRLIRLPAGGVLAMQMTGLSPPQPWQFCSGGADAILVENRAIKDYFCNAGLPRERIKVTGSPILDRLACDLGRGPELRRDLLQRLGMPQDRRIVVCALPPDQLDLRAGVCEFKQYEALVRFWIGTLRDNAEANLILSLHPRTPLETVQPLTGNRVAIMPGGAAGLIPLCDLFVASVSATIRWAIACGKPVLNYDVYRYGYDDYTSAEGVITLQDADEFAGQYHRLMHEPEYFEQIRDRQAACAAEWGELDGHASKRLLAAFGQLAGDEGPAVAAAPRPLVASTGVGS